MVTGDPYIRASRRPVMRRYPEGDRAGGRVIGDGLQHDHRVVGLSVSASSFGPHAKRHRGALPPQRRGPPAASLGQLRRYGAVIRAESAPAAASGQAVPQTTRTSPTAICAPGQPSQGPTGTNHGPLPTLARHRARSTGRRRGRRPTQLTEGGAGCACRLHRLVAPGRTDRELLAHHQPAEAAGCRPPVGPDIWHLRAAP
jgi:hypothetical protein